MRALYRCNLTLLVLLATPLLLAAPPVARDDALLVAAGSTLTTDVRLNDSDDDGDALTVVGLTQPLNGSVIDNGNGSLTYTPTAGFAGLDSFTYDVSDGQSSVTATASVSVNALIDAEQARNQLLAGVTALTNPTQPGHMVVYGPTAYSISNYPGADLSDPMIAAATLGQGRVVALPDHQWINMGSYGGDNSMAALYKNSVAWLGDSASLDLAIVTYDDSANAAWLQSQGYTNVVNATSGTLASALVGADVLVAAWLGSNVAQSTVDTIADFVRGGGGVFVADYGIGYDWWWGLETENIPGNRLLRDAGIAFAKSFPHGSSSQSINRGIGQVSFEDLLALIADWSSASQAERNQGADILVRVDSVLAVNSALQAQLDAQALASANTLNPTPTSPVSGSFEKALLVWESNYLLRRPVAETVAHPTALPVGASAPRINTTRTLTVPDGHATIRIPTGLYAAPGEIVTVTVPASLQSLGLRVRISHLRTDLNDTNFYHMPFQQVYFDLDSSSVNIASPFGGLIAVEAASGEDGINNAVFGFNNVVEAPYYFHGVTSDNDWNAGIRDRQTPFGVLVTEKTIHVIESEVHLRNLSDPTRVMQIWEDMIRHIEEFYSYTTYRPLRVHHDYQPAGGVSTFPQSYSVDRVMLDYLELVNYGHALTHHEYGHIIDPSQMIIRNFSEASPNFGGIYASRFFGPFTYRPKQAKERLSRYENSQSVDLWAAAPHSYHHEKITPFICLADTFGWDKLINVIAELKLLNPANDAQRLDNWLTQWGEEIGHDVSPFLALWQLSPSPAALAAVSGLPTWNMVELLEERLLVDRDGAIEFPSPANNDFSYDGVVTLVTLAQPLHGSVTLLESGNYQYLPDAGYIGADSFEYTVANGTGNEFTAAVEIMVLEPSNSPKLHVGVTTAQTGSWQIVPLPESYTAPVIVAQHLQTSGMPRLVTRIRAVTADSFQLRLQRPDGLSGAVSNVTVNYLVAEAGLYDEATHGLKMEAATRLSTVTDRDGSLIGESFEPLWNTLDHYAVPVVLGQVMSYNDSDWSTWWSNASSQQIIAGKHVGGDSDITRAAETLGYIAFESGTVQFNQAYLRFGNSSEEFLKSFGSSGDTLAFPDEPQITAAFAQATGLSGNDNPYWSVLNESNDYAGNVVSMRLLNDEGASTPSHRAGYLVAAQVGTDCNDNNSADSSDIALGLSSDCNSNGIPDDCEIAAGTLLDANNNGVADACEAPTFLRGDVNGNGSVDALTDALALLAYLFTGGSTPLCLDAADFNDDGAVAITDALATLIYQFQGGPPSALPGFACGVDPTEPDLSCETSTCP